MNECDRYCIECGKPVGAGWMARCEACYRRLFVFRKYTFRQREKVLYKLFGREYVLSRQGWNVNN
jgi:hypothetical protein